MDPTFASILLVYILKLVFEFMILWNINGQYLLIPIFFFVVGGDDVFVNLVCVCMYMCVFPHFGFASVK